MSVVEMGLVNRCTNCVYIIYNEKLEKYNSDLENQNKEILTANLDIK